MPCWTARIDAPNRAVATTRYCCSSTTLAYAPTKLHSWSSVTWIWTVKAFISSARDANTVNVRCGQKQFASCARSSRVDRRKSASSSIAAIPVAKREQELGAFGLR